MCITFWCYILSGSIGGILGLVQSLQLILKVSFVFYYVDLSLVIIVFFLKKMLHHYILWYNWATYVVWGISELNWCCVEFQFHVILSWFGFFFGLLPLSYLDLLVLSNISCNFFFFFLRKNISCNLSILKLPFLQNFLKIKVISR